jgi:hypothetical protein
MFMHWIGSDDLMSQLGAATQFHPEWDLLCRLRGEGREAARKWLDQNVEHVGLRSTIDFTEMFLGIGTGANDRMRRDPPSRGSSRASGIAGFATDASTATSNPCRLTDARPRGGGPAVTACDRITVCGESLMS